MIVNIGARLQLTSFQGAIDDTTVAHVSKPLLVVGVLGGVSACRALGCRVVGVKHVDEAEASAHFDGAVSCALIGALGFITVPLGF